MQQGGDPADATGKTDEQIKETLEKARQLGREIEDHKKKPLGLEVYLLLKKKKLN